MDAPDGELLKRYLDRKDEAAFATVVRRYLDQVHSVARRVTGNEEMARDVTQKTFIDLARKAVSIAHDQPLASWLHHVARCRAVDLVRTEARRKARERHIGSGATDLDSPGEPEWSALSPVVDELVDRLPREDRDLVLLRFYRNTPHSEIAAALGVTEATARKRISRAVGKLRDLLARRGITTSAAALATMLPAHAVTKAPVSLTSSVLSATAGITPLTSKLFITTLLAVTTTQKIVLAGTAVLLLGVVAFITTPESPATTTKPSRASREAMASNESGRSAPQDKEDEEGAAGAGSRTKSKVRVPVPEYTTEETIGLLSETMIPEVEFVDMSLNDVVTQLNVLAKKQGITDGRLVFALEDNDPENSIADLRTGELRLRNVPLGVVAKFICETSRVRYKVVGSTMTFVKIEHQPVPGEEPVEGAPGDPQPR